MPLNCRFPAGHSSSHECSFPINGALPGPQRRRPMVDQEQFSSTLEPALAPLFGSNEQLRPALAFYRSIGASRYVHEGEALLAASA